MRSRILVSALLVCVLGVTLLPAAAATERPSDGESATADTDASPTDLPPFYDPEPRIIGGTEADPDDYPWMGSISSGCGASLVHPEWLLSAAHCPTQPGHTVRLDVHDLTDPSQGITVTVAERINHADYQQLTIYDNDAMLLRLTEPVTDIEPVQMATMEDDADAYPDGSTVRPIGWGATSVGGPGSPVLLQVDLDVMDDCGNYTPAQITESMICAGVEGGGQDACQGDSGGPLFVPDDENDEHLHIGITSWGNSCALAGFPGVWARTAVVMRVDTEVPAQTGEAGVPVTLEATSGDPYGIEDTWEWDLSDAGLDPVTGENPSVTFPEEGTFEVTLTVTTEDGRTGTDTGTVQIGEAVDAPAITVTPDSLDIDVTASGTATAELEIANNGTADLTWDVEVAGSGTDAAPATRGERGAVDRAPGTSDAAPDALRDSRDPEPFVQDGGFEDGTPNAFWEEASATFDTPICSVLACGTGGGSGPNSGDWWTWFGGTPAGDEGSVSQEVIVEEDSTGLRFFLEIAASGGTGDDYMDVLIDDQPVFCVTEGDITDYATYTEVIVDISDYADGGTYDLTFESETFGPVSTNFFIDDVELTSDAATVDDAACDSPPPSCDTPLDGTWLTVAPDSGTTAAGGADTVVVTADGTDLDDGTHEALVCITSNDAGNPLVEVPVTVTIVDGLPASIEISPEVVAGEAVEGGSTTVDLDITNAGDDALSWDITTAAGDSAPRVEDGFTEGFESLAAMLADGWAEQNNSVPLGSANWFQGNPDVFGAHEGPADSYAGSNFNAAGIPGQLSNWLMTPEVTLAEGAEFSFWTMTGASGVWQDRLEVRLSTSGDSTDVGSSATDVGDFDDVLLVINEDFDNSYPTEWSEFTVTVEDVPEDATGRLAFRHWIDDTDLHSDFIGIDTFEFVPGDDTPVEPVACDTPADIEWLSVDPASGTTAGGATDTVSVTLDASTLVEGSYAALLCVASNDAANPLVEVPVTFDVVIDDGTDDDDAGDDDAGDDDAGDDDAGDDDGDDDAGDDDAGDDDGDDDGVDPGEPLPEGVVRVSGSNRFETAITISQATFGDGAAGSVVLARGDDFADSLAGTPLAVDRDAPVLLTVTDTLIDIVADEIQRVLPPGGTVYLLGGTAALDGSVEADLLGLGYTPVRLAGPERIGTSLAVAAELGSVDDILITNGFNFPDALAAGAAAAEVDGVVVLTTPDAADPQIDAFLAANPTATATAVGGPAARAYPDATPVFGPTREGTAMAIAEAFFDTPAAIAIARQDDFADALAGGAHIGRLGGPLLLTPDFLLHPDTEAYLCANAESITTGFVYGGTAAVSDQVLDLIADRMTATACL